MSSASDSMNAYEIHEREVRLWDGLTSATDRIVVLGATNRPGDIDAAFLRRMPKRFGINLPDVDQREKILKLVCNRTSL
jgi:ATPase family AAA domain-containing protein 1